MGGATIDPSFGMGASESALKRTLAENNITEASVLNTAILKQLFELHSKGEDYVELAQAKKIIFLLFTELNITVTKQEVTWLVSLCSGNDPANRSQFSLERFLSLVRSFLPQNKLSTSMLLSINYQTEKACTVQRSRLACGEKYSVSLDSEGRVWIWGQNEALNPPKPKQIPLQAEIIQIASGTNHIAMLDFYGNVWTQGSGVNGKLGHGDSFTRTIAKRIEALPPVVYVECGANFTCFIDENAMLWATGENHYGQLGLQDTKPRETPELVPELKNIQNVCCGLSHTIVINGFGSVLVCGSNIHGELGTGNIISVNTFVPLNFREMITSASAGHYFSVFLGASGNIFTCGDNSKYQLGLGNKSKVLKPTLVKKLSFITKVSCFDSHTLCLLESQELWSFGNNSFGALGIDSSLVHPSLLKYPVLVMSGVNEISQGFGNHSIVQNTSYQLLTFGNNSEFQLGYQGGVSTVPEKLEHAFSQSCGARDPKLPPNSFALQYSNRQSYDVKEQFTWELLRTKNIAGNTFITPEFVHELFLNFAEEEDKLLPKEEVEAVLFVLLNELNFPLTKNQVCNIVTDETASLSIFQRYIVKAIPYHRLPGTLQLLRGGENAWNVSSQNSLITSANGFIVTCLENGKVHGFGETYFNFRTDDKFLEITELPELKHIVSVVSGPDVVYCLDSQGKVWHFETDWPCRIAKPQWTHLPQIFDNNLPKVTAVSCGTHHALFLASDSTVWGLGSNRQGQLGLGDVNAVKQPTPIPDLNNIKGVYCGMIFSYCIAECGMIYSAGWNLSGQLSTGDCSNRNKFGCVIKETEVKSISCGSEHALFLVSDGNVFSCGTSEHGALGHGMQYSSFTPKRIEGLPKIKEISCHAGRSFCLDYEGLVWSFGEGKRGQLVQGLKADRNIPEIVYDIPPMVTISTFAFLKKQEQLAHHVQGIVMLDEAGYLWSFVDPSTPGIQDIPSLHKLSKRFPLPN